MNTSSVAEFNFSEQNDESMRLWSTRERALKKKSRKCVCLATVSIVSVVTVVAIVVGVSVGLQHRNRLRLPSDPYERALALLDVYPLIDG